MVALKARPPDSRSTLAAGFRSHTLTHVSAILVPQRHLRCTPHQVMPEGCHRVACCDTVCMASYRIANTGHSFYLTNLLVDPTIQLIPRLVYQINNLPYIRRNIQNSVLFNVTVSSVDGKQNRNTKHRWNENGREKPR